MVAATAPYVHKYFPKTVYDTSQEGIKNEEAYASGLIGSKTYTSTKKQIKRSYSFIGFSNKRRFLYAIGWPVSLFLFSIFGLALSKNIEQKTIKKRTSIAFSLCCISGSFGIAWNLWWYKTGTDFPRWAYDGTLLVIGVTTTVLMRLIVNGWYQEISKLKKLREDIIDFLLEIKEVHAMRPLLMILGKSTFTEAEKMTAKENSDEFDNRLKTKAHQYAGEE